MEWVPFGPPSDCLKTQEHEPRVCAHTHCVLFCGTRWATRCQIWTLNLEGGPWTTLEILVQSAVGPSFPIIQSLQLYEAWDRWKLSTIVFQVVGPHKGHLIKDLVQLSSRALMDDPTNQVLCGAGLSEAHYPPHPRSLGVNPLCKKTSSVRWVLVGLLLPFYECPELLKRPLLVLETSSDSF